MAKVITEYSARIRSNLPQHLDKTAMSAKKANMELTKVSRSARQMGGSTRGGGIEDMGKRAEKSAGGISKATLALAGLYATYKAFSHFARQADEWTNMSNKLRLVTKDADDLAKTQSRLLELAVETRTDVGSVVLTYQRVRKALGQTGGTAEETQKVVRGLALGIQTTGIAADEAKQALRQITQAFNKGKLDGDEFRSVSENMPVVLDAIAKHAGISRGELMKWAREGKITSDLMKAGIIASLTELEEDFEKITPSISTSATAVSSAWTGVLGTLNDSKAFTKPLVDFLTWFSESLMTIKGQIEDLDKAARVKPALDLQEREQYYTQEIAKLEARQKTDPNARKFMGIQAKGTISDFLGIGDERFNIPDIGHKLLGREGFTVEDLKLAREGVRQQYADLPEWQKTYGMARPGEGKVVKPFDTKGVDLGGDKKGGEDKTAQAIARLRTQLEGFDTEIEVLANRFDVAGGESEQFDKAIVKLGEKQEELYIRNREMIDGNTELSDVNTRVSGTLDNLISQGHERALKAAEEAEALRELQQAEAERIKRLEQEKKVLQDVATVGKEAIGGVLQSVAPAINEAGGGAGTILTAGLTGALSGGALGAAAGAAGAAAFWLAEEIKGKDEYKEAKEAQGAGTVQQIESDLADLKRSLEAGTITQERYDELLAPIAAQVFRLQETGQLSRGINALAEQRADDATIFGSDEGVRAEQVQDLGIMTHNLIKIHEDNVKQADEAKKAHEKQQEMVDEQQKANDLLREQLAEQQEQSRLQQQAAQLQLDAYRQEIALQAAANRDDIQRSTFAIGSTPTGGSATTNNRPLNVHVTLVDDPTMVDRRIEDDENIVLKPIYRNPEETGEAVS